MAAADAPMSWGKIILILLVVALGTGLVFGLLTELVGLSSGAAGGGIGGATGVTAAYLITQRRHAIAAQQRQKR
jgi:hypothetical protein